MQRRYETAHVQKGRGVGKTIGSFFNKTAPALKTFARGALAAPVTQDILDGAQNTAIKAGLNVVGDAITGQKLATNLKTNLEKARQDIADVLRSAGDAQLKRRKRRCCSKATGVKAKTTLPPARKRRRVDLFDDKDLESE